MRFPLILIVFVTTATMASAQVLTGGFDRVLVPTMISGEIPGAFGSRWTTDLVIRNGGDEFVRVTTNPGGICIAACPLDPAQPGTTVNYRFSVPIPGSGGFLYVAKPHSDLVRFNLRVVDLSRESLTWGTEIPIVREDDVHTDSIELLNVPTDARFRQMLRIYDFDGPNGNQVRVRIVDDTTNTELASTVVTLSPGPNNDPGLPGYAQIGSLADVFPQLIAAPAVRIRIEPLDAGLRFWAFVSVTNNETQHVTTITPQ